MKSVKLKVIIPISLFVIFVGSVQLFASDSSLLKLEELLLKGDYVRLRYECDYLLSNKPGIKGKDRAYYILSLALLKQRNFKEAREALENLKTEFPKTALLDDVELSIADTYFLEGNFEEAAMRYKRILIDYPRTDNMSIIYLRLGDSLRHTANLEEARYYFERLKKDFPSSFECSQIPEDKSGADIFYTVQAGSFTKEVNARKLCDELLKKGYDVYITKMEDGQKSFYRVRVGHFQSSLEAQYQQNKLKKEGYATRICP